MPTDAPWANHGLPAVIAQGLHAHALPFLLIGRAPNELDREHVMSVGEYIGFHADALADHALGRKAAGIHRRCDVLDDDARGGECELGHAHIAVALPDRVTAFHANDTHLTRRKRRTRIAILHG